MLPLDTTGEGQQLSWKSQRWSGLSNFCIVLKSLFRSSITYQVAFCNKLVKCSFGTRENTWTWKITWDASAPWVQIALKLELLYEYNLKLFVIGKKGHFHQYSCLCSFLLELSKLQRMQKKPALIFYVVLWYPFPGWWIPHCLQCILPPTSQQFWEVLLFLCTVLPRGIGRIHLLQWQTAPKNHWRSGFEKWRAFPHWWQTMRLNPHGLLSLKCKGSCCKLPS